MSTQDDRVPEGLRTAAARSAVALLREARTLLRDAGAAQAAGAVARALKSVEGAQRHAEGREAAARVGRRWRTAPPSAESEKAQHIAHAAGWDAGNRSAQAAGRSAWSAEDYAAARGEFERLVGQEPDAEAFGRPGTSAATSAPAAKGMAALATPPPPARER